LDTWSTGCGKQWAESLVRDAGGRGGRAGDWDIMAYVLLMGTVFCWEIHSPLK
jgi:hypothetical protein